MSIENNQSQSPQNVISSLLGEIRQSKVKVVKSKVKELLVEREKAVAVVAGIDEKIESAISEIGTVNSNQLAEILNEL